MTEYKIRFKTYKYQPISIHTKLNYIVQTLMDSLCHSVVFK